MSLLATNSKNTSQRIDKETLRKEFITRVYTAPPSISINVCIYCGAPNSHCQDCLQNNGVLISYVNSLNSLEFQDMIDIFFEWANATEDQRKLMIKENLQTLIASPIGYKYFTQPNDPQGAQPNQLGGSIHYEIYKEKPIPLHISKFIENYIIPSPLIYSQISNWVNSENPIQRIIFYLVSFRSYNSKIADLPFSCIIKDLQVFSEIEYLGLVCEIPTKETFKNVIEKVSVDEDIDLQPFHISIIFLMPCPTYEIPAKVCSDLLLRYRKTPVVDFHDFIKKVLNVHIFKEPSLKITYQNNPLIFDDYKEIIKYLYSTTEASFLQPEEAKPIKKMLFELSDYFKEDFHEFSMKLLDDSFIVDNDIHDILPIESNYIIIGILSFIDKFNNISEELSKKIDKFISVSIFSLNNTYPRLEEKNLIDKVQDPCKFLKNHKDLDYFNIYKLTKRLNQRSDVTKQDRSDIFEIHCLDIIDPSPDIHKIISQCMLLNEDGPSESIKLLLSSKKYPIMDEKYICRGVDTIKDLISMASHYKPLLRNLNIIVTEFFLQYLDAIQSEDDLDMEFISSQMNNFILKPLDSTLEKLFEFESVGKLFMESLNSKPVIDAIYKRVFEKGEQYQYESTLNIIKLFAERSTSYGILKFLNKWANQVKLDDAVLVFSYITSINIPQDSDLTSLVIFKFFQDTKIFRKLFELYDFNSSMNEDTTINTKKKASFGLYKLCEIALKLNLIPPDEEDLQENILEIIKKDNESDLIDLYSEWEPTTAQDLDTLVNFIQTCPYCTKSIKFMEFFYTLPTMFKSLRQSNVTYELEQLDRKRKQLFSPEKELEPFQKQLPNILMEKIIHSIYSDKKVHYKDKLDLALVSKTFFEMCSNILTNHFDHINHLNYMDIQYITLVHPNKEWCLWKSYPKLLNHEFSHDIEYDKIDYLFYEHFESISIIFEETQFQPLFSPIRDTILRFIEIDINYDIKTQDLINFIQHSPLLEKIELTLTINWLDFHKFLNGVLEHPKRHQNLHTISFYFDNAILDTEIPPSELFNCDITQLKESLNLSSYPLLNLTSIPEYIKFLGMDSTNVKFTADVDSIKFNEFYRPILSTLTTIQFSVESVDNAIIILKEVLQNHQTVKILSLRMYKLNKSQTTSLQNVTTIFELLDQYNMISEFTLYHSIYLSSDRFSVFYDGYKESPELWRKVLSNSNYISTNEAFTNFIKQQQTK